MPLPPRNRATSLLYGAFIAVTAAYVVSNIAQVATALFAEPRGKVGGACAVALSELVVAVESPERERVWASSRSRARACEGDPSGLDALAAAERYARATAPPAARARASAGESRDLAGVRHAAESFIR